MRAVARHLREENNNNIQPPEEHKPLRYVDRMEIKEEVINM